MSDDLDDGEIPKESTNDRIGSNSRSDCNDSRDSTHTPLSRDRNADSRPRPYVRTARSRSRTGYRSPLREDPYARRRPRSPRTYDRYSQDIQVASARSRLPAARKEPSVRDANTKADLGRLAREAEAAAYKARTAALNKNPAAMAKPNEVTSAAAAPQVRREMSTKVESSSASIRGESRSPLVAVGREDMRRPRDTSTARRRSKTRSPVRDRRPRSLTRRPSPEPIRTTLPVRRGLTAADIGRLEREKEAAAYKAKVLAEHKSQPKSTEATSQVKPSNNQDRKTVATSSAGNKAATPTTGKEKDATPVPAEVVIHIKSICPKLDSQLATMKLNYEVLLRHDHKRQADLRVCMRQWAILEREAQREAYKSELAQLSLEATSAM